MWACVCLIFGSSRHAENCSTFRVKRRKKLQIILFFHLVNFGKRVFDGILEFGQRNASQVRPTYAYASATCVNLVNNTVSNSLLAGFEKEERRSTYLFSAFGNGWMILFGSLAYTANMNNWQLHRHDSHASGFLFFFFFFNRIPPFFVPTKSRTGK